MGERGAKPKRPQLKQLRDVDWIAFTTAAAAMATENKSSPIKERQRLRDACAAGHIGSMKAPYDGPEGLLPIEFWTEITARDWRERDVDRDGPDSDGCDTAVMLSEQDLQSWRGKAAKSRSLSKVAIAKEAAVSLWQSNGAPPKTVSRSEAIKQVRKQLEAKGYTAAISDDTILRAIGHK